MERIHLVGRSADGARLVFARGGPDRTLFEVPISPELRDLVASEAPAEEAPGEETPRTSGPGHESGHVRLFPTTPDPAAPKGRAGGLAPGAIQRATGISAPLPAPGPRGVHALIGDGGTALSPPEPETAPPPPEPEPEQASATTDAVVHTIRPRLTTGEIQARLRAGMEVADVARLSGAPEDWVERLDQTVQRERHVVVGQMLIDHAAHPHRGRAPVPLGEALAAHLRRRGLRAEAIKEGWFAARPDAGPWRVAWDLAEDGAAGRAEWTYDPRSREPRPENELATELGWPPDASPSGPAPGHGVHL